MLKQARSAVPAPLRDKVTLQVGDAQRLPFATGTFDAVVDSFGLCSFEDPVIALREMRRVLKPGGVILLLEHGVADNAIAQWYQHRNSLWHVRRFGCFWDRDIEQILRDSGLQLVEKQKKHFGTTVMAVAQ